LAEYNGHDDRVHSDLASAMKQEVEDSEFVRACYRAILGREPDPLGFQHQLEKLQRGFTIDVMMSSFLNSPEFMDKFRKKAGIDFVRFVPSSKFPADYVTANNETGKSYASRRASGFFDKYLSGEKVLDVGYRGYSNPELITVVPHAIGVDLDYPGYDGLRLPFDDATIDTVFSSHCLEHIADYQQAIRDWHRVVKVGGFIVCIVPSQLLYEKRKELPSRYNADHKRFYSPGSLLGEFEGALMGNSYRVRHLEENDRNYNYNIGPESHADGCYEIVLAVEKIAPPSWRLE
jgi:SAM-dependent methyltransferase